MDDTYKTPDVVRGSKDAATVATVGQQPELDLAEIKGWLDQLIRQSTGILVRLRSQEFRQ